ncbi:MAG: nitroreductase family protein [Pseudomonadota bacterium]
MRGLAHSLAARFQDAPEVVETSGCETLATLAARGSCRRFADRPVDPSLLRMLLAVAFAAPTKSDLQQRDVVVVSDPAVRARLDALCGTQAWLARAPALLIFCGNHRRQRRLHDLRGHAFVNDHLDAFFNAAVDAGVLLGVFVTAAEAAGLGTCPVSAIRNEPRAVSETLDLPEHVFPAMALALGWPAAPPAISPRLPLGVTLHENRFDDSREAEQVAAYDAHRALGRPHASQRFTDRFGKTEPYTWSEDKARQYAEPERVGFGAFVRAKGFRLD